MVCEIERIFNVSALFVSADNWVLPKAYAILDTSFIYRQLLKPVMELKTVAYNCEIKYLKNCFPKEKNIFLFL